MKLIGIMPLRNGVKLGYPFEQAIRSLQGLCDEVIVALDTANDDETASRVAALGVTIQWSTWDMTNHGGHSGNSEIARQTAVAAGVASDLGADWVMSLQADELLHERECALVREDIERAEREGITAIEMTRFYFYGALTAVRDDWTVPLTRLYKAGHWQPDYTCGAMQFLPVSPEGERKMQGRGALYHYSRIGDPQQIAQRVRNLDHFYHHPDTIAGETEVPPYDFSALRKLDTYVQATVIEDDPNARLSSFELMNHPLAAQELYHRG